MQRDCSVYSGNAQDLKWINERTIAATSRKRIDTAIVFPQPHFITIRLVLIIEQGLHCVFQFAEPIFDQIKCEGLQNIPDCFPRYIDSSSVEEDLDGFYYFWFKGRRLDDILIFLLETGVAENNVLKYEE